MPSHRATFHWPPSVPSGPEASPSLPLKQRLEGVAEDAVSSARELVVESCRHLHEWLGARAEDREPDRAARELEDGLAGLGARQGWRGPVAVLLDSLRRTWHTAHADGSNASVRMALLDEVGLWLEAAREDPPGAESWDGAVPGEGTRLARRCDVQPSALRDLDHHETILVHGASETVAQVLCEAQRGGLAPEVLLTECGGDFAGKRMARRLADGGVTARLGYDAKVISSVGSVDRVWLGTEAIGAGEFLGRVGARLLLREAGRLEVPRAVLTTSDKVLPGGRLELPRWCADESWILWPDAPAGVGVESQMYEVVSIDLVDVWHTEAGRESATDLFLRALRSEAAPACTAI